MTLEVFTARIWRDDPDLLNITRGSGGDAGAPFAPSQAILEPALRAREEAKERKGGDEAAAERLEAAAWATYEPRYVEEMRASWRANRAAWRALLARPRVVLACYCTRRERCHRGLLAGILVKCGAVDLGELLDVREARAELAEIVAATRGLLEFGLMTSTLELPGDPELLERLSGADARDPEGAQPTPEAPRAAPPLPFARPARPAISAATWQAPMKFEPPATTRGGRAR